MKSFHQIRADTRDFGVFLLTSLSLAAWSHLQPHPAPITAHLSLHSEAASVTHSCSMKKENYLYPGCTGAAWSWMGPEGPGGLPGQPLPPHTAQRPWQPDARHLTHRQPRPAVTDGKFRACVTSVRKHFAGQAERVALIRSKRISVGRLFAW